jgi:hypothetical protein
MVFDVFVAMILEMKDSCDMTPCSLLVGYYHFEGKYCFGRTDGAEGSSETMVTSTKLHGVPSQDAVYFGGRLLPLRRNVLFREKRRSRRFLNDDNLYQNTRPHITGACNIN